MISPSNLSQLSPTEGPQAQPAQDPATLYQWQTDQRQTRGTGQATYEPRDFIDHGVLGPILKKYITKSGWVHYRRLKRNKRARKSLAYYVEDLSAIDPSTLKDPRDRLASWLNLYNAMVIDEILNHYPIRNILQIKNFYGEPRFTIGGEKYSLLDIEAKIFKKELREPRTLFARVNGAASGPRMMREPFHPLKIEEQLEERTWKFLLDKANVRYDPKMRMLHLNPIFLWNQEEFINIRGFMHGYLNLLPQFYGVSYLWYDWRLNDEKYH